MIKELVQFTETVLQDETFRNLGVSPKEGLHIILNVERTEEQTVISPKAEFVLFSKKTKELTPLHEKCAAWTKVAWMVDTNKCFDLPAKAIHSASPFCFALKRENLEGGEKFAENNKSGKLEVYDRVNSYFSKASTLLDLEEEKVISDAFRLAINDKSRLHQWLYDSGAFQDLKDADYVILYLDLPLNIYAAANRKYLKEKLFNTSDYNVEDENDPEILYGTSNWLNGFPTKKPFLQHQSATFDIAGRISSKEAQLLYEFSDLSRRKLFPNPLPIFIMKDELSEAAFKLYKNDAILGGDTKKNYLEIISELWKEFPDKLGNYYLLFLFKGEIKDFDFVSRFEYNLTPDKSPWKVDDLFGIGKMQLFTIEDLLKQVLPPLFNNALVVRRKEKDWIFHWFDEMDPSYCKTYNAFLIAMKYRKAFYDFIYKSKRQSVTGEAILDILMTGIKDDIRLDDYKNKQHSESYSIRMKLNLLFNLHQYFSTKPNPSFMASNIVNLRDRIDAVARGEAHIETDEQFAFAAGQVIARIFWESATGDESYRYLEPFLAQSKAIRFKESISNLFKRYKHGVYSDRFRNVSTEVMTYGLEGDLRDLHPHILAGVFSSNQLFSEKDRTNK
jgi:CRISPR-associated protein Csh1